MLESTLQAETELARNEPKFPAHSTLPPLIYGVAFGNFFNEVRLHPNGHPVVVDPRIGQILNSTLVIHLGTDGRQKSKAPVSIRNPQIVDLPRRESLLRLGVLPHRVILLAALTAKMGAIEEYLVLLPTGREALCIQRDLPDMIVVQGAVNLAGSADPLVQLEGKYGPAISCSYLLGFNKKSFQSPAGLFFFHGRIGY